MFRISLPCAAALMALLLVSAHGALAQQSTTATYADWVVRCNARASKPPQKICDMEQMTEVKGKNTPLSRIIIVRPEHGHSTDIVVQLPVNIWLASGVVLQLSEKKQSFSGKFTRCVPAGCFATIELNDAALKLLTGKAKPGKLLFKNAAGRDIAIPVSFNGFAQAFDALQKD